MRRHGGVRDVLCYAGRVRRAAFVLAAVALLAGCALSASLSTVDQRTSQGPTADEFWMAKMLTVNNRFPSFEEKRHFNDDLDARISKYLREHEVAASDQLTVQSFRNLHQVTAGMEKGQVEVLLGPPFSTSDDAQQMMNWARRHWPDIRGRADEAWGYPHGWIFYFNKGKLVDITQYLAGTPEQ
jgi:hypothetical protein